MPPTFIRARHYDGRTSASREALIALESAKDGTHILVRIADVDITFNLSSAAVGERVGETNRLIHLPDEATLEVLDNRAFDAALTLVGARTVEDPLRKFENHWRYAVLALLVVVGGSGGFLRFGVPALATRAMQFIPVSVDAVVGADGLRLLDRAVFQPTELTALRQSQLRQIFAAVTSTDLPANGAYRLEFRRGGTVGANALALPSGIVVLTDELEHLAHDDDELRGVLAHEAGHLVGRHAMRHLVESSATALLISGILGDVTSVSSLIAGVPTILVNSAYSRDLEREADGFAFRWMSGHHIDPRKLGNLLQRLAAQHGGENGGLLASHPSFKERMQESAAQPK